MTRDSAGATSTMPRSGLRSDDARYPLIGTAASGVATWKVKLSSR